MTPTQTLTAEWQRAFTALPGWHVLTALLGHNVHAHGDSRAWLESIAALPRVVSDDVEFGAIIRIGSDEDCDASTRQALRDRLMLLHPWRKGPFSLFGIQIDTEWRCDWKWARIAPHLSALDDRVVLDVGCGNGYYGWRMGAAGARCVVGVDPTILYTMQHVAIASYLRNVRPQFVNAVLPARLEDLPSGSAAFDTVFSMGVLYHRRNPLEHLRALHAHLRHGGELVLETLLVANGSTGVLIPDGRYARMRNVWHIPDSKTLLAWVSDAGFRDARIVDVTPTSTDEQRTTGWMRFDSLAEALDPNEPTQTIEGYPAPVRCALIATK